MQCPVCHNEVSPQNTFCTVTAERRSGGRGAAAAPAGAGTQAPATYAARAFIARLRLV